LARRVSAVTRANGDVVCEQCLVADSPFARMRGLLGRSDLPRTEGVLLRPASSIHTYFMRFPIDVVFLDRDLRVLKTSEHVHPWKAVRAKGAKVVLELRAGEVGRRRLRVGDMLELGGAVA
jgi:uncharacterized membrane protein (UPF0127 family)